jgi:hypothetical protein
LSFDVVGQRAMTILCKYLVFVRPAPIACLLLFMTATGVAQEHVLVGPNILVTRSADDPHTEPILAVDPNDYNRLVGAAVVSGRTQAGFYCSTYSSFDGGNTWFSASVPEQEEFGGADPQTAFGKRGTAYFASIALTGSLHAGSTLYFYRSEDGGRTWGKGVGLGSGDHEELAVDTSAGRYAGRIYVAMEHSAGKELGIYVFRSDDDGRSFIGPVLAGAHPGLGVNATGLQLFSDGSVFVPYITFETDPKNETNKRGLEFSISNDGGTTFSPSRHILDYLHPERAQLYQEYKSGSVVQYTFPEFAIDKSKGKYRDRIYLVWSDVQSGKARVLFAYSKDRGLTWSHSQAISAESSSAAVQFQPAITVNDQGTIGIEWFEAQDPRHEDSFNVYFVASGDGGASFSKAATVSSAVSFPLHDSDLRPFVMPDRGKDQLELYFLSPLNRWSGGGDYIGLASDASGTFHAFWPDARSGTYQIFTAAIQVVRDRITAKDSNPTSSKNVTDKISLVFDPISYDHTSGELTLPIRIRNISDETLYPPLTVEITALARPQFEESGLEDLLNIPEVLNATNRDIGVGAVFDYSNALGMLQVLPPGGLSDSIAWHLRLARPYYTTFYLKTEVKGHLVSENDRHQ